MKILKKRYPKGSLKGQKTDGRYIDGALYENLEILAKNVVRDMTYLGIASASTFEVGTGKSAFFQQLAEAYLEAVRKYHGIDNRLSMKNIVFRPKEIIKRAFEIPQYSVLICDEWEDAHYWSELGMSLRQFFRKCRQLNLLILLIIPNFFQLPMNYAISRSVFLIDVKFQGEFKRGYFSFYNFQTKKKLYIHGKKTMNYNVVRPNFSGRFADGYVVNEKEYRREKRLDLERQEEEEKKPMTEKEIKISVFKEFVENSPEITLKQLAKGFNISERTASRWKKRDGFGDSDNSPPTINYPNVNGDDEG